MLFGLGGLRPFAARLIRSLFSPSYRQKGRRDEKGKAAGGRGRQKTSTRECLESRIFSFAPFLPSLRRYDFPSLHFDVKRVLELLWAPKKLTRALVLCLCATSKKFFVPSFDRVLKETAYISISGGLADLDRKSIPQRISLSLFLFGGAQSPSFSRHFSSRPVIPWPCSGHLLTPGLKSAALLVPLRWASPPVPSPDMQH